METHGRVGAALTTTGRAGTARRHGSGKQDETPYERNQCPKPRNTSTGSNLADMGRVQCVPPMWVATPKPGKGPGGEATLKVCGVGVAMLPGYSWTAHSSTGWW